MRLVLSICFLDTNTNSIIERKMFLTCCCHFFKDFEFIGVKEHLSAILFPALLSRLNAVWVDRYHIKLELDAETGKIG